MEWGVYHIYIVCALAIFAGALWGGRKNPELMKAALVLIAQQAIISIWDRFIKTDADLGQAPLLFAGLSFAAIWVVTRIPAGKWSAAMAGIFLFSAFANSMFFITEYLQGFSPVRDWHNWACVMIAAIANLLLLFGFTNADRGHRVFSAVSIFIRGRKGSNSSGVAR